MKIYAIFNSLTNVWQCALTQGPEPEGEFDEVGDERWNAAVKNLEGIFPNSTDWIEISEEDFEKYRLGTSGGDNGTDYIRDPETNKPVSAPARIYTIEEKVAMIEQKYGQQISELTKAIAIADLQGDSDLKAELQEEYAQLMGVLFK